MSETQETNPSQSAGPKSLAGGGRRHRGRRGGRGRPRPPLAKPAAARESVAIPDSAPLVERVATLPERVESKGAPHSSAISQALDEVMQIVASLKQAVDQMDEVLELVELAERQKLADEQEIESLRRALRQLQRPRGSRPSEDDDRSS